MSKCIRRARSKVHGTRLTLSRPFTLAPEFDLGVLIEFFIQMERPHVTIIFSGSGDDLAEQVSRTLLDGLKRRAEERAGSQPATRTNERNSPPGVGAKRKVPANSS